MRTSLRQYLNFNYNEENICRLQCRKINTKESLPTKNGKFLPIECKFDYDEPSIIKFINDESKFKNNDKEILIYENEYERKIKVSIPIPSEHRTDVSKMIFFSDEDQIYCETKQKIICLRGSDKIFQPLYEYCVQIILK